MKTNLIFKRQVTVEGELKTVTRIVTVDIPQIESGEGWILSGHTDIIEVLDKNIVNSLVTSNNEGVKVDSITTTNFQSSVSGTAKLVRSKGVIKIVARRGKSTLNLTTPNSVCISDITKNEFFKSCRECHGSNTSCFEFRTTDGGFYDYWNGVIDKEYLRQKNVLR